MVRAKVKCPPEYYVLDLSYTAPSPPPTQAIRMTKSHTCVNSKTQQQTNITDICGTGTTTIVNNVGPMATTSASNLTKDHTRRTSQKEHGFPFYGQWGCKFCHLLSKTGTILCTATKNTQHDEYIMQEQQSYVCNYLQKMWPSIRSTNHATAT